MVALRPCFLKPALLLLLTLLHPLFAANDNGRGRHQQIYAVPVPGAMVIDGRLDDWDLSGQIEMFVIQATRDTQSARFALMYDDDALYVSGDVSDPTPMMNRHDPEANPDSAWNADSCQFRIVVDPQAAYPVEESTFKYGAKGKEPPEDTRDDIVHLLLWHYTDAARAYLKVEHGMTYRVVHPEEFPKGVVPGDRFAGKYLKREDGRGYTFEYRIPWKTLGAKKPLVAGDSVAGTVQFNWSRPDGLATGGGSAWAYDVLRQPGFPFQSAQIWGKIGFSREGNLPRELVSAGVPPEPVLPLEFRYEVPEDAQITLQLFDRNGQSRRILVAQQDRPAGMNIERWDGLDDHGNPLPSGEYLWKGIYHAPIAAKYRFSVHNSGTPAYPTDDNKGGWGSDHSSPTVVTALKDGMILAWGLAEYGWGIIRTDLNGRKQWGSKASASEIATDGKRLFFIGSGWGKTIPEVQIMDAKDSRRLTLEKGRGTIAAPPGGNGETNTVSGLACDDTTLYVAYAKRNLVALFDPATGTLKTTWNVSAPGRMALRPDGSLAVISEGKVISVADGQVSPWITTHLDEPVSVAVGADGTAWVANRGALENVSVFAPGGDYLRSIGRPGGRPAMGQYDREGMYQPGGIALDAKGRLWVAETTDGPKRISVWNPESGANEKEFFGGSGYFGLGFIDPARPDEIYSHHVLWKIDWQKNAATPITTIWRATKPNVMPDPSPDDYSGPVRMVTAKNGTQYLWGTRRPMSILMRREGDLFKPVAAFITLGADNSKPTGLPVLDEDRERFPKGHYFWQDANDDQIVDAGEITPVPREWRRAGFEQVDADLNIRLKSRHLLRPLSVTPTGRPVYDLAKAESDFLTGNALAMGYFFESEKGEKGSFRPVAQKDPVDTPSLIRWSADGKMVWSYPGILRWPDALSMPVTRAGSLWGMTGSLGVAGDYVGFMSYYGLNHLFRFSDGLYVAALLRDGRVGGRGPNEGQPEGQVGQLVKLRTGPGEPERYFAIHGGQDTRIWEVEGLETIKDLPGGVYRHTPEMAEKAAKAREATRQSEAPASALVLVPGGRAALESAPSAGKTAEDGRGFEARMAYDAEHLHVRFDVTSPNQLVNSVADPQIVFRGGNLLDIQIATDPKADPGRKTPAPGDLRLLVTRQKGKPYAVLYRPKVADFSGEATVLTSPTGQESFDEIAVNEEVELDYNPTETGFSATVTVPLRLLGLRPTKGEALRMDLGYLFGNPQGNRTARRLYLHNSGFAAHVVDDIPHESRLEPGQWQPVPVE